MLTGNNWRRLATALLLMAATGVPVQAAKVRYHYVPADAAGTMVLQPLGPGGPPGELIGWFGRNRTPYNCEPRPTCFPTFTHPCTGQAITVPLALPDSTPRMEHGTDF